MRERLKKRSGFDSMFLPVLKRLLGERERERERFWKLLTEYTECNERKKKGGNDR